MKHYIVLNYASGVVSMFTSDIEDSDDVMEKWAEQEEVDLDDCHWMCSDDPIDIETTAGVYKTHRRRKSDD
jgi:hypothetical protein